MIKKNKSLIEFITAFMVMTIILYCFIKRNNLVLEKKLDSGIQNLNVINKNIKDTLTKELDTMDIKQNYMIDKQFELSDSISLQKKQLIENNNLIKQNNALLKSIYSKQKQILKSIKN